MIANTYLAKGVHRSSSFLMAFHQVACAKDVQTLISLQVTLQVTFWSESYKKP